MVLHFIIPWFHWCSNSRMLDFTGAPFHWCSISLMHDFTGAPFCWCSISLVLPFPVLKFTSASFHWFFLSLVLHFTGALFYQCLILLLDFTGAPFFRGKYFSLFPWHLSRERFWIFFLRCKVKQSGLSPDIMTKLSWKCKNVKVLFSI